MNDEVFLSETLVINGEEYIKKSAIEKLYVKKYNSESVFAYSPEGYPFVIIRSYDAGCFCGYLKFQDDATRKVTLLNSVRMHQWFGASLSQLSQEGTPDAEKCRFAMPEIEKDVFNVIEKTPCTEKARLNLLSVPSWKI